MMNGTGKSDRPAVPEKSSNNAMEPAAEGTEGSGLAKGNLPQQRPSQCRCSASHLPCESAKGPLTPSSREGDPQPVHEIASGPSFSQRPGGAVWPAQYPRSVISLDQAAPPARAAKPGPTRRARA